MSTEQKKEALKFIFVHGLSGWGSYDEAYARTPYWGMRGGDLMAFLSGKGYECFAASVSPAGSAWDRACELYAQIAGRRVDYGSAHAKTYRHERFGRDFSSCPLIPSFSEHTRLVLIGHSFGGATVRLFSEMLANGDAGERAVPAKDFSPLFAGGMGRSIHALVTIASPMNGTTAYDLFSDPSFDPGSVRVPPWSRLFARMLSFRTGSAKDDRDERDHAGYDMHIDNAVAMNRRISTLEYVYYFSVPCSYTKRKSDGTYVPERGMEPLFEMRSRQIGAYSGHTKAGLEIDESWRENDGLVNTLSASCPSGAVSRPLDREHISRGIWNMFPVYRGDHMALQGGLMHRHDIRPFYLDLCGMITALDSAQEQGAI